MFQVTLTNKSLLRNLSNITKTIFDDKEVVDGLTMRAISVPERDKQYDMPEYSDEYLYKALEHPVEDFGYPRGALGLDTILSNKKYSRYFHDMMVPLLIPLSEFIGSHENALCMFYPENGYIGWHHNGNSPGYNFLMTYNPEGDGYFRSYNQQTNTFTTLNDIPGWNFRFGYYYSQRTDPERVFWHSAYTKSPRITIAFVVPSREMWLNLVEECGDVSHLDLDSIGP